MSDSPSRLVTWSRRFLYFALAAFVLLSIDWRPARSGAPPAVVEVVRGKGALVAGAAKVSIVPPMPTPIGGYNTRGNATFEGVAHPLFARAIVLGAGDKRIAFVSLELVALPAALRAKTLAAVADLKLDDLFMGATHTHSGVGGYWDKLIAGIIGIGSYDPRIESFLVEQAAAAIRAAAKQLVPARLSVGHIEASNYQENRDDRDVVPDKTMTGVRVDSLTGDRLARIVIYAVHPTMMPREGMALSGDWPGAMMTRLEERDGPTLFFQGAVGDVTWGKRAGDMTPEERTVRFGRAIAGDAEAAFTAGSEGITDGELSLARVRLQLPPADASPIVWLPFERMTSNIMQWLLRPGSTEVSYLRLGPLALAMVPCEPVTRLGIEWHRALGGATIVGLMDDYIGYVETPERIQQKVGEAERSYFGPSLAPLLLDSLERARAAAESPEAAH